MRIVIDRFYSDKTFQVTFEKFDLCKRASESYEIIVDDRYAIARMENYEIDIYSAALECAIEAYLNRKESEHEIRYHEGL